MKIWIECRSNGGYVHYFVWAGKSPEWSNKEREWVRGQESASCMCHAWAHFLLGPDFQYPEVGQLAELEVNHLETWEGG